MQRRSSLLAAAVVAVLLAAGLLALRSNPPESRSPGSAATTDTVERRLERMLESARQGDVEAYAECFGGEPRRMIEARLEATGRKAFAGELRASEFDLKSFVTRDADDSRAGRKVVLLERIFSSRNDLHRVTLERSGDRWLIIEMTPLERVAPQIPYGTPVVPQAESPTRSE